MGEWGSGAVVQRLRLLNHVLRIVVVPILNRGCQQDTALATARKGSLLCLLPRRHEGLTTTHPRPPVFPLYPS